MPLSDAEWDTFDSYLFDIDGTLLECRDAVHYFAFLECLRDISGQELTLEGVPVHGSTDPKIIADALRLAGVPEESWRPLIPAGLKGMAQQVGENRAQIRPRFCRAFSAFWNMRGAVARCWAWRQATWKRSAG